MSICVKFDVFHKEKKLRLNFIVHRCYIRHACTSDTDLGIEKGRACQINCCDTKEILENFQFLKKCKLIFGV